MHSCAASSESKYGSRYEAQESDFFPLWTLITSMIGARVGKKMQAVWKYSFSESSPVKCRTGASIPCHYRHTDDHDHDNNDRSSVRSLFRSTTTSPSLFWACFPAVDGSREISTKRRVDGGLDSPLRRFENVERRFLVWQWRVYWETCGCLVKGVVWWCSQCVVMLSGSPTEHIGIHSDVNNDPRGVRAMDGSRINRWWKEYIWWLGYLGIV